MKDFSISSKSFLKKASTLLSLYLFIIHLTFIAVAVILTGCASPPDSRSVEDSQPAKETQTGLATFIGESFHGKKTYSGESYDFDKNPLVAAHPSYPMGTVVRVTNLENQRTAKIRIIDRSAIAQNQKEGVILDLSPTAAEQIGFNKKKGEVRVRTEVLEWGKKTP